MRKALAFATVKALLMCLHVVHCLLVAKVTNASWNMICMVSLQATNCMFLTFSQASISWQTMVLKPYAMTPLLIAFGPPPKALCLLTDLLQAHNTLGARTCYVFKPLTMLCNLWHNMPTEWMQDKLMTLAKYT